jgi:ubiquinone/menaquinone biosynthesis methyltransferase
MGSKKAPRAELVVADAQALPFEDASISAVVCGFGIRNVSDPEKAIREVRRVLGKGGVFVTLEFFRPERALTRLFHAVYASCILPSVGGALSGEKGAYAYLARSMDGFLSRSEYERALCQAGFEKVTAEDLTFGVASLVRAQVGS